MGNLFYNYKIDYAFMIAYLGMFAIELYQKKYADAGMSAVLGLGVAIIVTVKKYYKDKG